MEVILDKSSATNATLKVSLKKEDYQPKFNKTIKEYSQRANLKGFRPGKVPVAVIQKMYGKSILIDEVNQTVSTAINEHIRENKLQVVGDPIINREKAAEIDWNNGNDFEFEYELGLASDFEADLAKLPAVPKYTILAGEKELNDTIEMLKTQFSEQKSVDVSEANDMVYGELKQVEGEFTTKTAVPFKQVKDEFQAIFVGLKKDDIATFDIQNTFVDEKAVKHLTGLREDEAAALTGNFTLTVSDISRQIPAEMNQEFFNRVLGHGKTDNVEDFKTQLLEIVSGNYVRESSALLRRDIEQSLLDNINIELPNEFLKKWLFEANEGKFTMEQIENDYDAFTKSMKLNLIKNKIAEKAEINISYDDIASYTEGMIRGQFGFYGNDLNDAMNDTINRITENYLNDEKGENYRKMFNEVFDDRLFVHIKEQISTTPKDIDVEQFKEIVKGLQQN